MFADSVGLVCPEVLKTFDFGLKPISPVTVRRWRKPNRRLYLETMEDILRAAQKDPTVLEES